MERPYLIDKPLGATPLQALEVFRRARGIPSATKLAYAGRLDPLATGLLPLLSGELLTRQEEYWYLPKEYEASVLLGISTDSYDLMGMPTVSSVAVPGIERIMATVRGMVGKTDLSVPVFSSHRIGGKPLFTWARTTDDGPPLVPVRRMAVSQIDITGTSELFAPDLLDMVSERVGLVQGDFRQEAISDSWRTTLDDGRYIPVVGLRVRCTSGTYIRSIVHEIGRRLGCGAIVADLRRISVGPWKVGDPDVVRISWPR